MTAPDAPPRCTDRCNRMTDRGLCGWRRRRLDRELSELAGLWDRLGAALLPAAGHGDGRGSGEPSIGVRVDVLSLRGPAGEPSALAAAEAGREYHPGDQTGATPLEPMLCSWARIVAEERNFAHRDRWNFATARKFLVAHFDWICSRMWADDLAAEIHEAHGVATGMAGLVDRPDRLPAACPSCEDAAKAAYECGEIDEDEMKRRINAAGLVRQNGAAVVECVVDGCRRSWKEEQYRWLVLVLAKAAREKAGAA